MMKALLPILILAAASCDRNQVEPSSQLESVQPASSKAPKANDAEPPLHVPETSNDAEPLLHVPETLKETDSGIFSEYDDQVKLRFPSWLEGHHKVVLRDDSGTSFAYVDGAPAGPAHSKMAPQIKVVEWAVADPDGDGIPSGYDILLGAKKTVINGAPYKGGYQKIDYPGGDVPRSEGVCTDLLVRAVRNAGIDLQQELHEDITTRPRAFPMVDEPDTNIDHRRVKTLLPYFLEHWEQVPGDLDHQTRTRSAGSRRPRSAGSGRTRSAGSGRTRSAGSRPWLPGDVVFMNTMGDERPDHVGIVSDRLGESGHPLIINNWTDGYNASEMDLLGFVPVTHRFRVRGNPRLPLEHMGVGGLR